MKRSSWICLLLFLAGPVWCAEVYRYVDSNGNVVYSDRPFSEDAEAIIIDTSVPTPVQPSEPAPAAPEVAAAAGEDGTGEPVLVEVSEEEIAAQRAANCAVAQERNLRYMTAHRIYRGTEDNREYLTDAELDAIRAEAAADVEEWCP